MSKSPPDNAPMRAMIEDALADDRDIENTGEAYRAEDVHAWMRQLAGFHGMVEKGLEDSNARRVISNEEMAQRIRTWRR